MRHSLLVTFAGHHIRILALHCSSSDTNAPLDICATLHAYRIGGRSILTCTNAQIEGKEKSRKGTALLLICTKKIFFHYEMQ